MKKFVFYDPMNHIRSIHLKKDHVELPRVFAAAGYTSYLISGKIDIERIDGIQYFETGNVSEKQYRLILDILPVLRKLLKEEPDVIMFFHNNIMFPLFVLLYRILRIFRKSSTTWIIMTDFNIDTSGIADRFFLKIRLAGLMVSSAFARFISVQSSCHRKVLSNYVRAEKIIPLQESYSSVFYSHYHYGNGRERKLLCVSRISREKGLEVLIEAASTLLKKYPDWKLEIVGPADDSKYLSDLSDMVERNGLQGMVTFPGYIDDESLTMKYRTDSIFCLPSYREGFSISRLEAAANGMPVVTSDAGCGSDLRNYGMQVFRRGDVEGLTMILERLMASEDLRREVSEMQLKSIKPFEYNIHEAIKIIESKTIHSK